MIYISAQPDSTYFIWQLEIQLRNLKQLGGCKDNIHVLIAHNNDLGLNPNFNTFIQDNISFATFFTYADLRHNPSYVSSIRPNITPINLYTKRKHHKKMDKITNRWFKIAVDYPAQNFSLKEFVEDSEGEIDQLFQYIANIKQK